MPAREGAVDHEWVGILWWDPDAFQLRRDVAPLLLQRPGQLLKLGLLFLHRGQDAGGRLHLWVVHEGKGRSRHGAGLKARWITKRRGRREKAPLTSHYREKVRGRREKVTGQRKTDELLIPEPKTPPVVSLQCRKQATTKPGSPPPVTDCSSRILCPLPLFNNPTRNNYWKERCNKIQVSVYTAGRGGSLWLRAVVMTWD